MLLKSLNITNQNRTIRNISFKKGLNLIISSTDSPHQHMSNSVGKTTAIRVLDFCLGAKTKNIYSNPESRDEINPFIFHYLKTNEVTANLSLQYDNGSILNLERTFMAKKHDRFDLVDGIPCQNTKSYRKALKFFLFPDAGQELDLRLLTPMMIRHTTEITHALPYLMQTESSKAPASAYQFLFGFQEELSRENGFDDQLNFFNAIFSEYMQKFYGEDISLKYDSDNAEFRLSDNAYGVGCGMRKGIIAIFNLAYIDFVREKRLPCPRFAAQDNLENLDINKLCTLLELANKLDGQYILTLLGSRAEQIDKSLIDGNVVLDLSERNQFFGI